MSEFFRALGGDGYGRRTDTTNKAQRRHEALCSTGVYCENERCPKGREWRARTGYRLKDPITGLRRTNDATVAESLVQAPTPERGEDRPENQQTREAEGQSKQGAESAVRLPELPRADVSGMGADTQETVEAREPTTTVKRRRGQRGSDRRPRKRRRR